MQNDILGGADVSADAITLCIKTKTNTLSAWEIASESDVSEAVLAIVSGGDHLETIHVVIMDKQHLTDHGISCSCKEEYTPVEDLRKTHHDLIALTYPKLGIIANHIVEGFKRERVIQYRERALRQILNDAVKMKRLDPSDLKPDISKKLP